MKPHQEFEFHCLEVDVVVGPDEGSQGVICREPDGNP